MNGMHDVGGMDGFPLPERDQGRVLKQEWERLVWGMLLATIGTPGVVGGAPRRFIESMPPELYLATPYYARFLLAREQALITAGLVTHEELRNPDGPVSMPNLPDFRPITPEQFVALASRDASDEMDVDVPPSFDVGDSVVVKNEHPVGHTRVPRYVRGRRGTIQRDHGVHRFQDDVSPGVTVGPQHLYTVAFTGPELWGARGHPRDRTHVELWEYHLGPADVGHRP